MKIGDVPRRKIGNLELAPVGHYLLHKKPYLTLEIDLRVGPDRLFTIASWEENSEGFRMRFVANRPFRDDVNKNHFWELAEKGQDILDEKFYKKKQENN